LFINDDNTSTEYFSGANDCYIDMDLGEYNVAKISKIRFIPSIDKHILAWWKIPRQEYNHWRVGRFVYYSYL